MILIGLLRFASGVAAATTGIDVPLPLAHHISGVITDPDGQPVAGADVSAMSNADGSTDGASATTADDGSYVLHAVPDGSYRVLASDRDGAFEARYYGDPDSTAEFTDATLVVIDGGNAGGIDVQLGAKPTGNGISGTVSDPNGHPVGGVQVSAGGELAFGTAMTATDGTYRVGGLPAGDYRIFFVAPEGSVLYGGPYVDGAIGQPDTDPTPVTVGDVDTTGADVVLPLGRTVHGRVTTTRPATIEVDINGPAGGTRAIAGANGNFEAHGLVPGEYTASFRDVLPGPEQTETGAFPYGSYGSGGTLVSPDAAATIDLTANNATLDPVVLPRGTEITGVVTDGKTGLADAYFAVCDVVGQRGCGYGTGQPDGTFRIPHVPTGSFTIFVSVPGRVMGFYQSNGFTIDDFAASPVKVVSGGPDVKGIKIAVPAGGVLSGRITGPGGAPIAGAAITAGPLGFAPNSIMPVSGADGRYTITGIPTNEYRVAVQAPVGSDYLSGYFEIGEAGHFTRDFEQATNVRVFEDRDRTAPTITFRDPAAGATEVSIQPEIAVRFSEPLENVTTSTVQLRDPRGRLVPTTVTFTPIERTARLTPSVALLPGTKYKVTLTSAIVDWSGNHFAGASWSFTTSP